MSVSKAVGLDFPSATDRVPHLRVDGVSLVYSTSRGPLTALQDLTLGVGRGEFVSVLGPSGCGKSTLLKLASGLIQPTSGFISLKGDAVTKPRSDVGIVFQSPTLLPWKTVFENVMAPIYALRRDASEYRGAAEALIKLVGLERFRNHYPHELSGGMQQRVSVARSFVHDPALLLMDEPFAALDAMTREHMMVELQRIWSRTSKSVLFITHSIPEAMFLSDRIVVMSGRPGSVLADVDIRLPRPRSMETMGDLQFVRLSNELRAMFREQSEGAER